MSDPNDYIREVTEMLLRKDPPTDVDAWQLRVASLDAMVAMQVADRVVGISALQYAGLIGKYIRMERDATPDELMLTDETTVGMECVVTSVIDIEGGVEIRGETHEVWTVTQHDAPLWRWHIWDSETVRREYARQVR
jgi:hypothetical protein